MAEDDRERIELSAQEASQGHVVLRSRRRRVIFLAGLVGIVVLAIIMRLALL